METQPEEPVSMICGKCDREPTSAQIKKAMKHCEDCNTWFHARCVNSKGKSFTCIKVNRYTGLMFILFIVQSSSRNY